MLADILNALRSVRLATLEPRLSGTDAVSYLCCRNTRQHNQGEWTSGWVVWAGGGLIKELVCKERTMRAALVTSGLDLGAMVETRRTCNSKRRDP